MQQAFIKKLFGVYYCVSKHRYDIFVCSCHEQEVKFIRLLATTKLFVGFFLNGVFDFYCSPLFLLCKKSKKKIIPAVVK